MSIVIPPSAWRFQPDWPHYIVADSNGAEWRISQLELSSRLIPNVYS